MLKVNVIKRSLRLGKVMPKGIQSGYQDIDGQRERLMRPCDYAATALGNISHQTTQRVMLMKLVKHISFMKGMFYHDRDEYCLSS